MQDTEKKRIIIVDDDLIIRQELKHILEREQYDVQHAANPPAADEILTSFAADLMILDLNMPGFENGKYYCRRICESLNIPIIIITASDDEIDEILSYELGALHFMHKPFNTRLLIAKIRNILSIAYKPKTHTEKSLWRIDSKTFTLSRHDTEQSISINKNEYLLLSYLNDNHSEAKSQHDIAQVIYNRPIAADDRIISTLISRLRQKLESIASDDLIVSMRGIGYSLKSNITID
ncbi:response regulator transcription factor [Cysteiniphilum sp. QT6929]|uniref:response regulator transcription factor n=1 Tax=Cysteiniphilum sp. QT6929 TaxID=2975055 RepID=UPI0024B3400A|nr:response regulator transcription factor [Cysteiniphilum sp. QT6929]WHN64550.1 response regulator transcription factor [Cysteiniphilum sp. QT6929]